MNIRLWFDNGYIETCTSLKLVCDYGRYDLLIDSSPGYFSRYIEFTRRTKLQLFIDEVN